MSADTQARPTRSAEQWLLDAAVYAREGDLEQAIAAAERAIAILAGTDDAV